MVSPRDEGGWLDLEGREIFAPKDQVLRPDDLDGDGEGEGI